MVACTLFHNIVIVWNKYQWHLQTYILLSCVEIAVATKACVCVVCNIDSKNEFNWKLRSHFQFIFGDFLDLF